MEITSECGRLERVKYLFDRHDVRRILRAHVKRDYPDYACGGIWSFEWWDDDKGRLFVELVQELEVKTDG